MPDARFRSLTYRPDVDGLRALAVLAVIGFHGLPQWIPGGYIGVDVFFVVSGYLISSIILQGLERGTFSFTNFYARRIRRIFPAALLVMAVCLAVGWFGLLADEYKNLGKHVAAGSGFVSNVALWQESGYFDVEAALKPLLHLWSLGIEEQFYLLWPLLLYLTWKRRAHGWAIALVFVVSFAINVYLVTRSLSADFYLPFSRFWELSAGSALAMLPLARTNGPATRGRDAAAVAGLLMMVTATFSLGQETAFPGWWALVPTAGTCLVIWAGSNAAVNRTLLSHPILVFVGLISYSLYLWHWPLLSFIVIAGQRFPSRALRFVLLTVTVLLAWLTYVIVERPVRRRGARAAIVLLLAAVVVGSAGYATWAMDGFPSRIVRKNNFPVNRLAVRKGTTDLPGTTDCRSDLLDQPNTYCRMMANPKVALLGDSHARRLFSGFAQSEDPFYNKVMLAARGSCEPTLGADSVPGCSDQLAAALKLIEAKGTVRVVLLTSLFSNRIQPLGAAPALSQDDLFFEGYARTLARLKALNTEVYFVKDVPTLNFNPEDCIEIRPIRLTSTVAPADCTMPRQVFDEQRAAYNARIDRLQRLHPDLHVFDPSEVFCDEARCHGLIDGLLQYNDFHHLSAYGSARFARAFMARLGSRR